MHGKNLGLAEVKRIAAFAFAGFGELVEQQLLT
jgi:hypothetical protein